MSIQNINAPITHAIQGDLRSKEFPGLPPQLVGGDYHKCPLTGDKGQHQLEDRRYLESTHQLSWVRTIFNIDPFLMDSSPTFVVWKFSKASASITAYRRQLSCFPTATSISLGPACSNQGGWQVATIPPFIKKKDSGPSVPCDRVL